MSTFFSQSKGERDMKTVKTANGETRFEPAQTLTTTTATQVSTLGADMLLTGNIVCAGAINIQGRVVGDIHAAQLLISEGARVEGKVTAIDTVIQGSFNGTIHGNNVKLARTAVVDGEIFNKSLTIETDALFEGVARRLTHTVTAPTAAQVKGEETATPLSPVTQTPTMDLTVNDQTTTQTYAPVYSQ